MPPSRGEVWDQPHTSPDEKRGGAEFVVQADVITYSSQALESALVPWHTRGLPLAAETFSCFKSLPFFSVIFMHIFKTCIYSMYTYIYLLSLYKELAYVTVGLARQVWNPWNWRQTGREKSQAGWYSVDACQSRPLGKHKPLNLILTTRRKLSLSHILLRELHNVKTGCLWTWRLKF